MPASLQELPEFIQRKPGIANNASHGYGVYRVVPWNGQYSLPIAHHDMFALSDDAKPGLLQRTDRGVVRHAR